jgi:phosphoenolpyruvate carboxykinase (ATP)
MGRSSTTPIPSCTGRPTKDTFAVARPEVIDTVWWKDDFFQFEPAKFDGLLVRVIAHLNERNATLYVTDVFCGGTRVRRALPLRRRVRHPRVLRNNMFPAGRARA